MKKKTAALSLTASETHTLVEVLSRDLEKYKGCYQYTQIREALNKLARLVVKFEAVKP
jgi:hypothetical protein